MLCRFCGNVICGKCGEHERLHPRTNSNKRICTKCNASVATSLPSSLSPTEKHGLCGAEWRDGAFAYFHENSDHDYFYRVSNTSQKSDQLSQVSFSLAGCDLEEGFEEIMLQVL